MPPGPDRARWIGAGHPHRLLCPTRRDRSEIVTLEESGRGESRVLCGEGGIPATRDRQRATIPGQVDNDMTGRSSASATTPHDRRTREIEGVTLHLSAPDASDQSWIGQDAILRQL